MCKINSGVKNKFTKLEEHKTKDTEQRNKNQQNAYSNGQQKTILNFNLEFNFKTFH